VARVIAEHHPVPMEFVGIEDTYAESGSPQQLLEKYGLTAEHIRQAGKRAVERKD
jgi:transketolase